MKAIHRIGIIGEGKMGSSICQYLLDFPYMLTWLCSPGADVTAIKRQLNRRADRSRKLGILDEPSYRRIIETNVTIDPAAVADCDLIIEATPENQALKQQLFKTLHHVVKPGSILTTNSSSFIPSVLSPNPERLKTMAGLHFFYPVALKNIVEVTLTDQTVEETQSVIEHFLDRIGRSYLLLGEQNSFILNRIYLDVQVEALRIVTDGHCTHLQMDKLVTKNLFPFGIFDFCDSVGLETMLISIQNYINSYSDKAYYQPFINELSNLVNAGKKGLSGSEGFHVYPVDWDSVTLPDTGEEITGYLRQIWLSSVRRFTVQSRLPIEAMNYAVREYFGMEQGPFDLAK